MFSYVISVISVTGDATAGVRLAHSVCARRNDGDNSVLLEQRTIIGRAHCLAVRRNCFASH
jgi:hypothetical protein